MKKKEKKEKKEEEENKKKEGRKRRRRRRRRKKKKKKEKKKKKKPKIESKCSERLMCASPHFSGVFPKSPLDGRERGDEGNGDQFLTITTAIIKTLRPSRGIRRQQICSRHLSLEQAG